MTSVTDLYPARARSAYPFAKTPALTFEAWRSPDDGQSRTGKDRKRVRPGLKPQAYPVGVRNAASLEEAVNSAIVQCQHKDHLTVIERHAGEDRTVAHVYAIRKDTTPKRFDRQTGKAVYELYAQHLFDMQMDAMVPKRPFDALRDDAVGIDRGLVAL